MKDAVNDTIFLDELSAKLVRLESRICSATEVLVSTLEKSRQFLEGTQFSSAEDNVKSAVKTQKAVCADIKNAREFVLNLKKIIAEYSKLTF